MFTPARHSAARVRVLADAVRRCLARQLFPLKPNEVPMAAQLAALQTAQEQAHSVARAMQARAGEGRPW